jgi:hypothetical protein
MDFRRRFPCRQSTRSLGMNRFLFLFASSTLTADFFLAGSTLPADPIWPRRDSWNSPLQISHAHHMVRNLIGLSLKRVVRRADLQFRLNARRNPR